MSEPVPTAKPVKKSIFKKSAWQTAEPQTGPKDDLQMFSRAGGGFKDILKEEEVRNQREAERRKAEEQAREEQRLIEKRLEEELRQRKKRKVSEDPPVPTSSGSKS